MKVFDIHNNSVGFVEKAKSLEILNILNKYATFLGSITVVSDEKSGRQECVIEFMRSLDEISELQASTSNDIFSKALSVEYIIT